MILEPNLELVSYLSKFSLGLIKRKIKITFSAYLLTLSYRYNISSSTPEISINSGGGGNEREHFITQYFPGLELPTTF